jgi:hypothetical protein
MEMREDMVSFADEARKLLEEFPVRPGFLGLLEPMVREMDELTISPQVRDRLRRILVEVFRLETANHRLAETRLRSLHQLRDALQTHLRMLERLKSQLEQRRASAAGQRRFSLDDLPPN